MSRYLFVVPPFRSHVNPTVAVGGELARRGHEVAWVAYEGMREVVPPEAAFHALPGTVSPDIAQRLLESSVAPFVSGFRGLFEDVLVPMARDMLPGVEAAIADWKPDALIVDQMTYAGALAARRAGLPWATSASTPMAYDDGEMELPKVSEWLQQLLSGLERDCGLAPSEQVAMSPTLVILYTSRAFAGGERTFPRHYLFVGPALEGRSTGQSAIAPRAGARRVFVSLGTIVAGRGERFFRCVTEALGEEPEQVLLHVPADIHFTAPSNFVVRPWFPLIDLLPEIDVVVTHGGTTLVEALAFAVPAVVAPVAFDQVLYAGLAERAGTARRVSFRRVTAVELRNAVREVLDTPSFAARARDIQASFREAGGAPAAAAAIEAMA